MKTYPLAMIMAAALIAAAAAQAAAQDEKSWKGKTVLPTKRTKDIKFGDYVEGKQVYFPMRAIASFVVRDDSEGWLRIHDGEREGWVDKADFVLARDAPAYFHGRVQANPKDTDALFMRGVGWLRKGEPDNAIKDFDECIRLNPTDSAAFTSRGNAWSAKKDHDRAIKDYDEAIRLDPKYALAFNNRGIAWRAKKEYDKAIKDYDEAIRLDPKYAFAFNGRGNAWSDKKEYGKAIKDYDEAIRLDPKSAFAFTNRGNAWRARKEYDKAIRDYDEAIRLDPKRAWALMNRGLAWYYKEQYDTAIKDYHEAIRLDPKRAEPFLLGQFAARRAKDEAAAKRFLQESAAKLDTSAWPFPVIRFLRGDIDEPALLKLATDDDKRTEARCYLGLDHLLKGRKDEALAHFRWVKEHGTADFIEYAVAVAELERLEGGKK